VPTAWRLLGARATVGAQLAEFDFTALAQRATRQRDELEVFHAEAAAEAFAGEPRVND
jgi:hypothetical protein